MKSISTKEQKQDGLTLVLGGTGKTGRRILTRLEAKGIATRIGSRSAVPAFDWNNEANWDDCLDGVDAVYINFAPDLAIRAMTLNPAKVMGLEDEIGTIEVGKRADLLLVDGDPLDLRSPVAGVWLDGVKA